jgi:hypothetical protein
MALISMRTQGSAVNPVRLTPQGLKAVPLRAFQVGCLHLLLCQFNFMPGPNSTGRRKRHLHPLFSPEIQFPPFRAPGPIPVSRPQAPVASWRASVCPSLTLQHACADLNTVGHSKPSALDRGNVSIISSHFPLLSVLR